MYTSITSVPYIYIHTQLFKQSALSLAAGRGHTDTVQVLLQRGADINEQDKVCTRLEMDISSNTSCAMEKIHTCTYIHK